MSISISIALIFISYHRGFISFLFFSIVIDSVSTKSLFQTQKIHLTINALWIHSSNNNVLLFQMNLSLIHSIKHFAFIFIFIRIDSFLFFSCSPLLMVHEWIQIMFTFTTFRFKCIFLPSGSLRSSRSKRANGLSRDHLSFSLTNNVCVY